MPDPRIAAARCRGALTAAMARADTVDLTGMPTLMRQFLVDDLPLLLEALHDSGGGRHNDGHLSPQDQIVEAPAHRPGWSNWST